MSYNRKALRVDLGKYSKPNPYKKDIITDPAGQWKYPGQPTRIPSNQITMQGVPYPVYGQDNTGFAQMMYPGQEYTFPGNYVDEYPQMKVGGIPELPLNAGRRAYHAWGYTNNDFIAKRQVGGDYIEAELTPEEIEEYRKGGYIVEDISVPQLTKAQEGLEQEIYRNQEVPEVPIVAKAPDWLKFSREYENIKSKDAFVEEKKKKYLRQNKGLNKLAGLSMTNFPKEVENNFANEYDYKKNTYVTRKLGKKEGFNPRHRGDWVDELTPGETQVVANSKYGSKLEPGAYARTLAGAQELVNALIKNEPGRKGDVLRYNIPGLTSREQQEIAESPTGALEIFAALDAPTGYNVVNFLKNRGLSTGSNYKELPGIASGELMPNVSEGEASAFNPFTYYGLESIPALGLKGLKNIGKGTNKLVKAGANKTKGLVLNPIVRNFEKSASKYFKPSMHTLTDLPTAEELNRMHEIERASNVGTYNRLGESPRIEDFSTVERFNQQKDVFNKKLATVQNYIKNSKLSDKDVEKIFNKTKDEILAMKPATDASPTLAEGTTTLLPEGSINLTRPARIRQNRVDQLMAQMPTQTSNPVYHTLDQDVISNLSSTPMYDATILNQFPERLSTEQYNDLNNFYEGMLESQRIDPNALSQADYDLMSNIYNRLDTNYQHISNPSKKQKLKNIGQQMQADIQEPLSFRDVRNAYEGKSAAPKGSTEKVKTVVPSFYARDFESPREALDFVQSKLDDGFKNSEVGDIITGSMNTSNDSYRVQMDYIFKNAGKEGLSEPIFLGYAPMNDSGFLTNAGIYNEDILKKINSDLNKLQKRTGKNLNLKDYPPMLDVDEITGESKILLPHYGVKKLSNDISKLKKKKQGGAIELELSPEEIQDYIDQGYTVEYID